MERRILGLDPGLAILGFGAICTPDENVDIIPHQILLQLQLR
jgi:Holliday junction resolvasome RuvABC endonuclease subunit